MNNELSPGATVTSAQTTLEQMTTSQLHQQLYQNKLFLKKLIDEDKIYFIHFSQYKVNRLSL
jgi:hypothetical protein